MSVSPSSGNDMTDIIKQQSWRYQRQSLMIICGLFLIGLLVAQVAVMPQLITPLIVSAIFSLVIDLADAAIWRRVASRSPESLPTFFMGVSGFRMLLAIGVMFVYYLATDRGDMLTFFVVFLVFYVVLLIHHALFFARGQQEK